MTSRGFKWRSKREAFQVEAVATEYLVSSTPQPLSVNTCSLAVAENMADLIDGHCRLGGSSESSLIIRPCKGTLCVKCFPGYNNISTCHKTMLVMSQNDGILLQTQQSKVCKRSLNNL